MNPTNKIILNAPQDLCVDVLIRRYMRAGILKNCLNDGISMYDYNIIGRGILEVYRLGV